MKLTLHRKIGTPQDGLEFAVTLTTSDKLAREREIDHDTALPALAKALDIIQHLVFPESVTTAGHPHPQDYALCMRVADGVLVRMALTQDQDLQALEAHGYRYLSGAYDQAGKLLPTFWTLPIALSDEGAKPEVTWDRQLP
jgi:hypothetical protein